MHVSTYICTTLLLSVSVCLSLYLKCRFAVCRAKAGHIPVHQTDIVKAQKLSHSAERKAAAKPERLPGSSRRAGGELGKNRAGSAAAPPDGHKTSDKPSGGRSGQKRSRTRSPEKSRMANGISKSQSKLSDAQRAKSSPDAQKSGAKASSLRNGKISAAPKDLDKDVKKEWIYADKASACMLNCCRAEADGFDVA